jgi:type I restriction enzyme S subunit
MTPLRALYRRVEERDRADLPLLSVYRELGVVLREGREDNFNVASDDLSTYKVVQPGDIVLNKMKTWQGSLGVSDYEGIVSPAYFVGRKIADADDRYLHHLLRSAPLIAEYGARSKGIRPNQWDLPWEEFAAIKVSLPPIDSQRMIADHLDVETARIDTLISKKQRMVELLDERLDAFIDAQVAQFFESSPIKRVAKVRYGLGQPPETSESGIPILRATNINKGTITATGMIYADSAAIPWDRCPHLKVGEILVVRSGALTGDSAIIDEEWEGSAPGYDLRLTPQLINPTFLAFQLLGGQAFRQIELVRGRAAQPHLNAEDLGEVTVKRGTPSEEQRVAKVLTKATRSKNEMSGRLSQQLLLLGERRQAVITAAVTGQLNIPEVAA